MKHKRKSKIWDVKKVLLFDLKSDPLENNDISGKNRDIADNLLNKLKKKAEKSVETEKVQRGTLRPSSKKKHNVSDDKQEEYTKHEALKNMTLLEQHLREGCRIMGEPCDCCEGKHLATIEGLADEGISFGINPIWENIKVWTVERGDRVESIPHNESADEAIKEGKVLAEELRQLRKQL